MRIVTARSSKTKATTSKKKSHLNLQLSSNDFIFSQCTIASSVQLESNSFKIDQRCIPYVNDNGETWSNGSMKANYDSFKGAYNYVNHVQEPERSVGFIADACLRKIILKEDPQKKTFVYYPEILVATHRDHKDLVSKILTNAVEYLSMGCLAFHSQCSKCGFEFSEEGEECECLLSGKGMMYIDSGGHKRIIAELLGTVEPGSCEFCEASWLTEIPAFGGAMKRNSLRIPKGLSVKILMSEAVFNKPAVQMYVGNL